MNNTDDFFRPMGAPPLAPGHLPAVRRTDKAIGQAYMMARDGNAPANVYVAIVRDLGNTAYLRFYFSMLDAPDTVGHFTALYFLPARFRDGRFYRLELVRHIATVAAVNAQPVVYSYQAPR